MLSVTKRTRPRTECLSLNYAEASIAVSRAKDLIDYAQLLLLGRNSRFTIFLGPSLGKSFRM
jgi:hypothetical protein